MERVIENNRLIAEFMGYESHNFPNLPNRVHIETEGVSYGMDLSQCLYDTSWDWLMPVVSKIQVLGYRFEMFSQKSNVNEGEYYTNIQIGDTKYSKADIEKERTAKEDTKLQTTYEAIVEFIKWYNEYLLSTDKTKTV